MSYVCQKSKQHRQTLSQFISANAWDVVIVVEDTPGITIRCPRVDGPAQIDPWSPKTAFFNIRSFCFVLVPTNYGSGLAGTRIQTDSKKGYDRNPIYG